MEEKNYEVPIATLSTTITLPKLCCSNPRSSNTVLHLPSPDIRVCARARIVHVHAQGGMCVCEPVLL